MNDFIVAGVGGQGVITCSRLILETALEKGYEVRSAETIGMAQRGGSVYSHIRIGEKVNSPFIPMGKVDEVISMKYVEAFRYQNYLKTSGIIETVIDGEEDINSKILVRKDIDVKHYDIEKVWEKIGNKKIINIILLGIVFSDDRYVISYKDIEKTIVKKYIGKIRKQNLEALYLGTSMKQGGAFYD